MTKFKYNPGDLLGENKLELLERTTKKGTDWSGKFKCTCGNIFECRISDVAKSHTRSCGCLGLKTKSLNGSKNGKNLIGEKYGLLTVLEKTDLRSSRHIVWKCQCECGNSCLISSSKWGKTYSCGCVLSKGEQKIQSILERNNIEFIKQKKFDSLIYNNQLMRFDFYLPTYNILIEYDGILHYKSQQYGWDTLDKLYDTQCRDEYKNQWCKKHNIPLIRISYTDFKNINDEYLFKKIAEVT